LAFTEHGDKAPIDLFQAIRRLSDTPRAKVHANRIHGEHRLT
jgi:hypothetical protein